MLDNSVAYRRRQKIDNRTVDFRRCRKRPAFFSGIGDNFFNLIGQLLVNAAIGFRFPLGAFGDGICVAPTRAIAYGKSTRQVCNFIRKPAVSVGQVERLNKLQAGTASRRFVYSISFQAAAICHDNE